MGIASAVVGHLATAMQKHRNCRLTQQARRKKPTDCEVAYRLPLHKLGPVTENQGRVPEAFPGIAKCEPKPWYQRSPYTRGPHKNPLEEQT